MLRTIKLDLNSAAGAKPHPFAAARNESQRRQVDRTKEVLMLAQHALRTDPEVQFAALQPGQKVFADGFAEPYLDLGSERREVRQEGRKHAVESSAGRRHLQHPALSAPQRLGALAEGADRPQDRAAVREQLLTFRGEQQPPADAVEELDAEFFLESANLTGQGRLGGMKTDGRSGNGGVLDDRREGV